MSKSNTHPPTWGKTFLYGRKRRGFDQPRTRGYKGAPPSPIDLDDATEASYEYEAGKVQRRYDDQQELEGTDYVKRTTESF